MMRALTRAVIFTVTVLSSYLVTGFLEDKVLSETERFRPGTATALGMAIIVLIFVPVFAFTERLTESAVHTGLQQTKRGAGRILGIVFFVLIVFTILFALYLDKWFNMSIGDLF